MKLFIGYFIFLFGINNGNCIAQDDGAQKKRSLSLREGSLVGFFSGATEVALTGQPLRYVSNMKALKIACSSHPLHWYKGFPVTVASMAPITALQKACRVQGEKMLQNGKSEELSALQKLCVASVSGALSALVATPCEAVPIYSQYMQHTKNVSLTSVEAFKQLKWNAWRGLSLVGPRNALYTAAYGSLAGHVKREAEVVVGASPLTTAFSGMGTGAAAATLTQPLAVVKTILQADPFKKIYPTAWSVAHYLYQKEGIKGFFRGLLLGRGPRIVCAVPILSKAEEVYAELILED